MEDPFSASSQNMVILGGSCWIRQSPPSNKECLGKGIILIQPWVCGLKRLVYWMETAISVATYQDIDLKSTVETSSPEVPTMLEVR